MESMTLISKKTVGMIIIPVLFFGYHEVRLYKLERLFKENPNMLSQVNANKQLESAREELRVGTRSFVGSIMSILDDGSLRVEGLLLDYEKIDVLRNFRTEENLPAYKKIFLVKLVSGAVSDAERKDFTIGRRIEIQTTESVYKARDTIQAQKIVILE